MLRLSLCVLLFSNNKTRNCMVLRAFSAYCIILAIIFLHFHIYIERGKEKTNGRRDIHPESETNKPIEMQHYCYKYTPYITRRYIFVHKIREPFLDTQICIYHTATGMEDNPCMCMYVCVAMASSHCGGYKQIPLVYR